MEPLRSPLELAVAQMRDAMQMVLGLDKSGFAIFDTAMNVVFQDRKTPRGKPPVKGNPAVATDKTQTKGQRPATAKIEEDPAKPGIARIKEILKSVTPQVKDSGSSKLRMNFSSIAKNPPPSKWGPDAQLEQNLIDGNISPIFVSDSEVSPTVRTIKPTKPAKRALDGNFSSDDEVLRNIGHAIRKRAKTQEASRIEESTEDAGQKPPPQSNAITKSVTSKGRKPGKTTDGPPIVTGTAPAQTVTGTPASEKSSTSTVRKPTKAVTPKKTKPTKATPGEGVRETPASEKSSTSTPRKSIRDRKRVNRYGMK